MLFKNALTLAAVSLCLGASPSLALAGDFSCTRDGERIYTQKQKEEMSIENHETLSISEVKVLETKCPTYIVIKAASSNSSSTIVYNNSAYDNDPSLGEICYYVSPFAGLKLRCEI